MALFSHHAATRAPDPALAPFLAGFSIEVMPRTAARIDDFRALLPAGTRVYITHIDGTPIEDGISTAARIIGEGFPVMPHFPARSIRDRAMLDDWIARYRDAGVSEALVIAGGRKEPLGAFESSIQLLETGAFDGFSRLHVAGHPEGNADVDHDGTDRLVMEAARWKAAFAEKSAARMAMTTQFCFDAAPVIRWTERLRAEGVTFPVHIGTAGPAKLQTLLKFAVLSGVGASLSVLRKRALDVSKLLLPYEPTEFLADLARHKADHPDFAIESVHFFPFGGIGKTAEWAVQHAGAQVVAAG